MDTMETKKNPAKSPSYNRLASFFSMPKIRRVRNLRLFIETSDDYRQGPRAYARVIRSKSKHPKDEEYEAAVRAVKDRFVVYLWVECGSSSSEPLRLKSFSLYEKAKRFCVSQFAKHNAIMPFESDGGMTSVYHSTGARRPLVSNCDDESSSSLAWDQCAENPDDNPSFLLIVSYPDCVETWPLNWASIW